MFSLESPPMPPEDEQRTILPGETVADSKRPELDATADSSHQQQPSDPKLPLGFGMDSKSWGGTAIGSDAGPSAPKSGARYKILSQLGEGGFGIVYLADQTEPVRRKVALKVLKMAFASPSMRARFEAEQQALAIMDHPGLAKVFDAGTTPDGQPYFAMEYAPGEPLAAFCDHHRLDTRARIKLLASVCDAIQHAHMKGVVHRDLKPGNILVCETDEGIRPKVIDFGIAKAVSASVGDRPLETQFGQFVGTPVYMSPEQAEGGSIDIDTRSDIYSLGVILYELLVGTTPIESETLRKSGLAHLHRTILDTEPPRPSMRLATVSPDERERITRARSTKVAPLTRLLRQDLDWVTMRCLEKDRTRRYESASGLALDLRRYLDGEAVLAGPPGKAYRIKKFARKHRIPLAAGALAAVGLIVFSISMWFVSQHAIAQQRRATKTLDVFVSALKSTDVTGSQSEASNTIQGLLLKVEESATKTLADEPDILLNLRETIGPVLTSLADYDSARRNITPLVEARRAGAAWGGKPEGIALANALYEYGRVLFFLKKFPESRSAYEESLALRKKFLYGRDPQIGTSLLHLSAVYRALGENEKSDQASDEAIALFRLATDDRQERLGAALFSRADSLRKANRVDESRVFINEAVEVFIRNEGANHWRVGRGLSLLADLETASGRFDLAAVHQRRAIALIEPRYGASHATVTNARHKLANYLLMLATGGSNSQPGTSVVDAAALTEGIEQIRSAIEGRMQDDQAPIETAKSLALLSVLSELDADVATSISSETRIINMLRERAPQAAEQIMNAQKRLAALQRPSAPAVPLP